MISQAKTILGAAFFLTTSLGGTAFAQSSPSAQDLINSLKPTGTVSETTRGIKPLAPGEGTMAPTPSMTPKTTMVSTSVHPAAHTASANLDVMFKSGSADLTPKAEAQLDQLGKALTSADLASYNFKIVGHTDTVGDASTNMTLSQKRASAVKTYLETKYGVADQRLDVSGVGESDLLVKTPPQTANVENRRVEVVNTGK